MNRNYIAGCLAGMILIAITGNAQETRPGGYSAAAVTDKEVVAAAQFAIKAQQKVMQEKKDAQPAKLALVKIAGAQKQVVAGMNFKLSLKVKVNAEEKEAEAVVYRKLSNKFELTSWEWKK